MGDFVLISLMISSAAILLLSWMGRMVYKIWWRPMKLNKYLKKQGIRGPPYRWVVGNIFDDFAMSQQARLKPLNLSHNIVPRVMPFLHQTVKNFGKMSMFWVGTRARVIIMDPELTREILSDKSGHFEKVNVGPVVKVLLSGLVTHDGEKWAKHRRILNPAFHQEKLKRMLPAFHTSCCELINRWKESVGSTGSCELDMWPEFQYLTGDVISRTAFGSSYKEGMRIFQLQAEQARILVEHVRTLFIPGYRFLPTKSNIRRNEIHKEVHSLLKGMIEQREKEIKMGNARNDLLGLLLESNLKDSQEQGSSKAVAVAMTIEDVIEECKLFYFAGHETTAVLLTWTLIVLGMHTDWQTQAREEVMQVFGKNDPDFDGLNHLKIVTMILYEVLRLYPPAVALTRSASKTMKLKDITLLAGMEVSLPILLIHHDPEIWGEDADEFKPERFSEGISKASKNQVGFFPFGWGPRICIGQNFAMIEAKMALAMILQNFSFELSPSYTHAPCTVITLQPQFGAQIILHKL